MAQCCSDGGEGSRFAVSFGGIYLSYSAFVTLRWCALAHVSTFQLCRFCGDWFDYVTFVEICCTIIIFLFSRRWWFVCGLGFEFFRLLKSLKCTSFGRLWNNATVFHETSVAMAAGALWTVSRFLTQRKKNNADMWTFECAGCVRDKSAFH